MKKITLFVLIVLVMGCSQGTAHKVGDNKIAAPIESPSTETTVSTGGVTPATENTAGEIIVTEFDPQQFAVDALNYIMTFKMLTPENIDQSPYAYDAIANDCLNQKSGICGDRAIAMIMLMRRNTPSLPARIVGIFGLSGFGVQCHATHACMEVYYSESWHFFDPTFGVYFPSASGRVMSFDEVIHNAYAPETLTRAIGTDSNKSLVLGFAQSHYGLVYGEEEYNEFTKYLVR
jgi:hypothetical protein